MPTIGMAFLLWRTYQGDFEELTTAIALGLWVMMIFGNAAMLDVREQREREERAERRREERERKRAR